MPPSPPVATFTQGSVARHVLVNACYGTFGLMSLFIVDLTDLYFLSQLDPVILGAAVGFAGIVLFLVGSVSMGFMISTVALVGRAVGAGNVAEARRLVAHIVLTSILFTCPFAVVMWVFAPDVLRLTGASGDALAAAVTYNRIILPTIPLLTIAMIGSAVLRATGYLWLAATSIAMAGLVNLILDPIFIFVLDGGIAGAAYASICGRACAFLISWYGVLRLARMIDRPQWALWGQDARRCLGISVAATASGLAIPLDNAFVVSMASRYGEHVVSGFALVTRLEPVLFGVLFALGGAVGPVVAQNFGARSLHRVRQALLVTTLFMAVVVAVASLGIFSFQSQVAEWFNAGPDSGVILATFANGVSILFLFTGLQIVSNTIFDTLGKAHWSTISNWGRVVLGTLPFVWLGQHWFGAAGILWGQALGGIAFGLCSLWLARRLIDGHARLAALPANV